MYAAGYGIRPLRSTRPVPYNVQAKRWAAGVAVCLVAALGVARAVHTSAGPPADVNMTVTVQPGDTLWTIAAEHYPSDDVQRRVADIEQANGLSGPRIGVGETLRLP
jgi:nucleoid-associated protein YgaU